MGAHSDFRGETIRIRSTFYYFFKGDVLLWKKFHSNSWKLGLESI